MKNQNQDVQSPEQIDELKKTRENAIAKKRNALRWGFLIFIWVYVGLLFYVGVRWVISEQKVSLEAILLILTGLSLLVLIHKRSLFHFKKRERIEKQNQDVQSPEQFSELKKTGENAIADKLLLIFIWVLVGFLIGSLFFTGGLIIKFEQKVSLEPILLIVAGLALLVLLLVYGRKVERPSKESYK